ncbi:MAG: dTDP-4-dehydrorhamnose reductase [Paracoccaceae bacterium]
MRILLFGHSGQVAREIRRLDPDVQSLGRADADLSDPARCTRAIKATDAEIVINAAAYTAVDKAEQEPALAMSVNAEAPAAMAAAAGSRGVPFLHISTDYVYDGSGDRPWREDDPTGPLGIYGQSKLAGDIGVAAAGGDWAILRTSWVFSAHGANFVKTMLRLGRERQALSVVADQIGNPTAAADIAAALLAMARAFLAGAGKTGVYHFAGAPAVSWAGFAREIFGQAALAVDVTDIATADYPTPARRPRNSRLDCAAIARDYGIAQPDWRRSLERVLIELEKAG